MTRLRKVVPVDAAFFATVDPATLLFTSAMADDPLRAVTAQFLDNEFGRPDVNKFAALAASPEPVSSLDRATAGDRAASPRYREIMAPLSLGDELRAAFVVGGRCWGVMCLHRENSAAGFVEDELSFIRRLVPRVALGLRDAVLVERALGEPTNTGPGIVVLDHNLGIVGCNHQGEYWLDQLDPAAGPEGLGDRKPPAQPDDLPVAVRAVAAQLAGWPPTPDLRPTPRVRVPTRSGQWLVLHGSLLRSPTGSQTAVVLEAASGTMLGSLVLDAHGLTQAQSRVASLVLQGRSTRQIVNDLAISANTVQEHLHAVFEKFGVGSRRELVAMLLGGRSPR
jgi:DNA-binding CsgD family transcriptional regulator